MVALAVGFGGGLAVGRATAPKSAAGNAAAVSTPNYTNPVTSTPATSAGSAASSATSSRGATAGSSSSLINALLPVPPGGQLRTAAHAGADGSMTLDEFLADLYPNSSTERASLEARGFVSAATRWFIAANRQEVSIYLVSFGSPSGAQSYALALAKARGADPSFASATRFAVPALTDGAGFETLTLDSYGNTESFVYGAVKDVTVIVHCFTPAKPDRSQLLSFVGRQAARLAALH